MISLTKVWLAQNLVALLFLCGCTLHPAEHARARDGWEAIGHEGEPASDSRILEAGLASNITHTVKEALASLGVERDFVLLTYGTRFWTVQVHPGVNETAPIELRGFRGSLLPEERARLRNWIRR